MKKIIVLLIIGIILFSCRKDSSSTNVLGGIASTDTSANPAADSTKTAQLISHTSWYAYRYVISEILRPGDTTITYTTLIADTCAQKQTYSFLPDSSFIISANCLDGTSTPTTGVYTVLNDSLFAGACIPPGPPHVFLPIGGGSPGVSSVPYCDSTTHFIGINWSKIVEISDTDLQVRYSAYCGQCFINDETMYTTTYKPIN